MVAKDHPQRLVVQEDRVKHWLSVGARPTDRVHKFLASLDLMPAFEYREQPKKSADFLGCSLYSKAGIRSNEAKNL